MDYRDPATDPATEPAASDSAGAAPRPGPAADRPGHNVTLRPEAAPDWMHRLVTGLDGEGGSREVRRLRERLTGRTGDGDSVRPAGRTGRRQAATARDTRGAAVLVAVSGETAADASVLLTHRSPHMRSHAGQIAFPGGRIDPGDAGPVDAALREAWEETGLDRTAVSPLAELGAVPVRRTGRPVHPVLAWWHTPAEVGVASPAETDHVFSAPIAELVDPGRRFTVAWGPWRGPAFAVEGYVVWGFTAAVLDGMLRTAGWERPWSQRPARPLRETLAESRNNETLR